MAREAKFFEHFKGSPARALLRMEANIPPKWVERARFARKQREKYLVPSLRKLQEIRKNRPRAAVQIKAAEAELKLLLKDWEVSYQKEIFYNGLRILLELSRNGKSER